MWQQLTAPPPHPPTPTSSTSQSLYSLLRSQSLYPVQITVTVSCAGYSHCILYRLQSLYSLLRSQSLYSLLRSQSLYPVQITVTVSCTDYSHCIPCLDQSLYSLLRSQSLYPVQITVTVSCTDYSHCIPCLDHSHCILCRSQSPYPLPGSICSLAWIPCLGHSCCILCFNQSPYSQSRSQSLCSPFTLAPVAPGWHPTWAISTTPAKWLPLLQHHHTIKRQSNSMTFITNVITTCIFTQFDISE